MSQLARLRPELRAFASSLSLAAHVDRVLVRRMRLSLFHRREARIEAELWFCPLVSARDADAIEFAGDALNELRSELAQDPVRLRAARDVVLATHAYAPPTLRLEEEVIWLSISGASIGDINAQLGRAVKAMAERPKALARWAAQAVPRLPSAARAASSAWALAIGASTQVKSTNLTTGSPPEQAFAWCAGLLSAATRKVALSVRLVRGGIEIGPAETEGAHALAVPDTTPRLLELEWGDPGDDVLISRRLALQPDERQYVPGPTGSVRIRTLLGETSELRPLPTVVGSAVLENTRLTPAQEAELEFVPDPELRAHLRTGNMVAFVARSEHVSDQALDRLVALPLEHIVCVGDPMRLEQAHARVFKERALVLHAETPQLLQEDLRKGDGRSYWRMPAFSREEYPFASNPADAIGQTVDALYDVPVLLVGEFDFDASLEVDVGRTTMPIPAWGLTARSAPTFALDWERAHHINAVRFVPDFIGWFAQVARAAVRCFISYRRNDLELASRVRAVLVAAGASVHSDQDALPRSSSGLTLRRGQISKADLYLALVSDAALESKWLHEQLQFAIQTRSTTGKPRIVPIWTSSRAFEGSPQQLRDLVGIRRETPSDDPRLFKELEQLVAQLSPPSEPPKREIPPRDDERGELYIERNADRIVMSLAARSGQTVVIEGPRGFGKTTLLGRYCHECRRVGKRVGVVDFQQLDSNALATYEAFLASVGLRLQEEFEVQKPTIPRSQSQLTTIVQREILQVGPAVIALDEVERVLEYPYSQDFFSLLRSWHNQRALAALGTHRRAFDLAIATAAEPNALIRSASQSPFNIGTNVRLQAFTLQECGELGARHPRRLRPNENKQVFELLAGHPYLTRLAFDWLSHGEHSVEELLERSTSGGGPFRSYLETFLPVLERDPDAMRAAHLLARDGREPENRAMTARLLYSGFFKRNERGRIEPASLLFARFLADLGAR